MSTGNLEGKVVRSDFWPACRNCKFYGSCLIEPRHRAFPHTWHWGREATEVNPGRTLVIRSWVGTTVIGARHSGCYDYQAGEGYVSEPDEAEKEYLKLEEEIDRLNEELIVYEQNNIYNDEVEKLYQRHCELIERERCLKERGR